jgi:hypothetical protein
MDSNDIKSLPRYDQGLLASGILLFILSLFLPYYGFDVKGPASDFIGGGDSTSAWHSYGTFALILLLAATIIAAILIFSSSALPELPVGWNVVVLGLSALGTLLFIIRSFTYDSGDLGGVSYGLEWGAYVLMLLALAHTVFAFLRTRAAGDAMPWDSRGTAAPPPAA